MPHDENLARNSIESQDFSWESEINSELKNALFEHIIDIEPHVSGNLEKQRSLGDAVVGAADVEVPRCSINMSKLALRGGESIVLIGPNGAGKSTVYDAIMSLRNADFDTKSGSGAYVYGKPAHAREKLRIARLNQEEVLKQIGHLTAREILGQTTNYFKTQLPVDWENADAYEKNLANQDACQRIDELISQATALFEMDDFLDRKVDQLSGGERTKIVLLTILASEPDLLLLDEPTNHLDMASITKLMGLFDKYKRAGAAVVSVSHVDWFLRQAGQDGVVEITRDGENREVRQSSSSYDSYIRDRSRPGSQMGGKIDWGERSSKFGKAAVSTPEKITIQNSPIKDVKLPTIAFGEVVFLLGDNGTGKTKLLEAMQGSREIPRGKGINIAYMPQFWPKEIVDGTAEDFFNWVYENTDQSGARDASRLGVSRNRFIKELNRFEGEGKSLLKKPLSSFSGGEQRLLWLLAVSAQESADVLLLDEPTNHMDRGLRAKVTEALRDFKGAVVIASHDIDLIKVLSQDAGRGPIKPRSFVLAKNKGKTSVSEAKSADVYIKDATEKAAKAAKRVKV